MQRHSCHNEKKKKKKIPSHILFNIKVTYLCDDFLIV